MRSALDRNQWDAVIGAAKNLAEAACKVKIADNGQKTPSDSSLGKLVKAAVGTDLDAQVATRLAGTLDALGNLSSNDRGDGHGQAAVQRADRGAAQLAAAAAAAIARFTFAAGWPRNWR